MAGSSAVPAGLTVMDREEIWPGSGSGEEESSTTLPASSVSEISGGGKKGRIEGGEWAGEADSRKAGRVGAGGRSCSPAPAPPPVINRLSVVKGESGGSSGGSAGRCGAGRGAVRLYLGTGGGPPA